MNMRRPGSLQIVRIATLLVAFSVGSQADAQIYKYRKKDGTVVFTDKLSDLPPERRAHYNRKAAEQKKKRERELKRMTPAERKAAELTAQREKLMAQEMAEADRQRHLAEIDKALRAWRKRKAKDEARRAFWREKAVDAQKELDEAVAAYRAARLEYEKLAIKVSFSRLPGENARLAELLKALPELEAAVDAANKRLTETLPAEARKAGVPVSWLR